MVHLRCQGGEQIPGSSISTVCTCRKGCEDELSAQLISKEAEGQVFPPTRITVEAKIDHFLEKRSDV